MDELYTRSEEVKKFLGESVSDEEFKEKLDQIMKP